MRIEFCILIIILISCQSNSSQSSDVSENNKFSEDTGCELKDLSTYLLINQEGDTVHFTDFIKGDYMLLLTYTESVCRPCIEEYFDLLNQISDITIDINKVVLISRYSNLRNVRIDGQISGFQIYNMVSKEQCLEIPEFIEQYPRLILVNDELEIINNRYGFPGDSLSNPAFQEIIPYLD